MARAMTSRRLESLALELLTIFGMLIAVVPSDAARGSGDTIVECP